MLSQLAKLATKLDSFGLQKEADVLDAFIKRAVDGEYSEVGGEYHPSAEEEEMFGKWHDDVNNQDDKNSHQRGSLRKIIEIAAGADIENMDDDGVWSMLNVIRDICE